MKKRKKGVEVKEEQKITAFFKIIQKSDKETEDKVTNVEENLTSETCSSQTVIVKSVISSNCAIDEKGKEGDLHKLSLEENSDSNMYGKGSSYYLDEDTEEDIEELRLAKKRRSIIDGNARRILKPGSINTDLESMNDSLFPTTILPVKNNRRTILSGVMCEKSSSDASFADTSNSVDAEIVSNPVEDKFIKKRLLANLSLESPTKKFKNQLRITDEDTTMETDNYSNFDPTTIKLKKPVFEDTPLETDNYLKFDPTTIKLKKPVFKAKNLLDDLNRGVLLDENISQKFEENMNILPEKVIKTEEKCAYKEENKENMDISPEKVIKTEGKSANAEENKKNINYSASSTFDDGWNSVFNSVDLPTDELNLENWEYCTVLEIQEPNYFCKVIRVQSVTNKKTAYCSLEQYWKNMKVKVGNRVNIVAKKQSGDIPFVITNTFGIIIFEPDLLISPTNIMKALSCARRGLFAYQFRMESGNKYLAIGSVVHTLVEDAMKNKILRTQILKNKLEEILISRDFVYKAYCDKLSVREIERNISPYIPKIAYFIRQYIKAANNSQGFQDTVKDSRNWNGKIECVLETERTICSTKLGIIGTVDAVIKVNGINVPIPFELKTGSDFMYTDHVGQLSIYGMLMSAIGANVESGLLVYLKDEKVRHVLFNDHAKRSLIGLRNDHAYYIVNFPSLINALNTKTDETSEKEPVELPPPINDSKICMGCEYLTVCTLLTSTEDLKLPEDHILKSYYEKLLKRLRPSQIRYYIVWLALIMLEFTFEILQKEQKDIWHVLPVERERRGGRSLCYLKLKGWVSKDENAFIHSFERISNDEFTTSMEEGLKKDFSLSEFEVGTSVIISTEVQVKLIMGIVISVSKNEIQVSIMKNLLENYSDQIFHLDIYESRNLISTILSNLGKLMDDSETSARLREIIIDRKPPAMCNPFPTNLVSVGYDILETLNKEQYRCVLRAANMNDYMLIKGMPGTGKTATIVALVLFLIRTKKSILITSYTHSAVDNVCLRLLDHGIKLLRIGYESRIHPDVKHRSEKELTKDCKTVEDFENFFNSVQVVAVTCLAAKHPLFQRRTFDVCLVDECTQVLQCSVVRALMAAKSFVLIGDPNQLSPVICSPDAIREGMAETLFDRLDTPRATVTLTEQYRMNQVIMNLANLVTYNGQMKCANNAVANAVLEIPNSQLLQISYEAELWLLRTLNPKLQHSVMILDTGPVWEWTTMENMRLDDNLTDEYDVENKCVNICESAVIQYLLQALKLGGVLPDSVGVMAPYRAQVSYIKNVLSNADEYFSNIEVNTIDQYQGRDKDVILLSCTRSRDNSKIQNDNKFEILADLRRLTVAITRSKYKLIIIGDIQTLNIYEPFQKLFNSATDDQILKLESGVNGFSWDKVFQWTA